MASASLTPSAEAQLFYDCPAGLKQRQDDAAIAIEQSAPGPLRLGEAAQRGGAVPGMLFPDQPHARTMALEGPRCVARTITAAIVHEDDLGARHLRQDVIDDVLHHGLDGGRCIEGGEYG